MRVALMLLSFNSRPTSRLGAASAASTGIGCRFQSSPNLSAGCSLGALEMLRALRNKASSDMFQSSPTYRLGASSSSRAFRRVGACIFQFSPNLSAGCSLITAGGVFIPFWFQSSLNLSAGCIWAMEAFQLLRSLAMPHVFSILAQPLGWVQRLTCYG